MMVKKKMAATARWLARCSSLITLELILYIFFVLLGVYALTVVAAFVPFFGISDAPAEAKINKVGLSLQSVKHILFEEELSSLFAPSPPPPPR